MKFYVTTLLFLVLGNTIFAQQISLKGQVTIHNSKYHTGSLEYVKNAYVTAPLTAAPDDTDENGQFELVFVGLDSGTSVALTVEKAEMEVVNKHDLLDVTIGRNSVLHVYLITKGQLVKAQTEFFKISTETLLAFENITLDKLYASDAESKKAIEELEELFGQELGNRFDAIKILNIKIKEFKTRLPEFAQELASKNLDFASELYINAFEYFRLGKIEKAIELLDDAKLEESTQEALNMVDEGTKLETIGKELQKKGLLQIEQIISSYELKAKSYSLVFNYSLAAEQYEKIIKIYEVIKIKKNKLAFFYLKTARALKMSGDYEKALKYSLKASENLQKGLAQNHVFLAKAYNIISECYCLIGKYNIALKYSIEDIKIKENITNTDQYELASSYSSIAIIYRQLSEFENALRYSLKSIKIFDKILNPIHPELAEQYNRVSYIYNDLTEHEKALQYNLKSLDISEKTLDSMHPNMAGAYQSISITYYQLGRFEEALEYILKSKDILESIYTPDHSQLAITYSNISIIYEALGKHEESLNYILKDLNIKIKTSPQNLPELANSYNNIAHIYHKQGQFNKALDYSFKDIAIKKRIFKPDNLSLALSYKFIAEIYLDLGICETALEYILKDIAIKEKVLSPNHIYLSRSYQIISHIYICLGDSEKALEYYKMFFSILFTLPDYQKRKAIKELLR